MDLLSTGAIDLTALVRDLVRIPSITGSAACTDVARFVARLFENTPYNVRWIEHRGVVSLCIARDRSLSYDLVFLGHLDVVPAPLHLFDPREEGGWMYGRGAADMKGSVAAMVKLFIDHRFDPLFDRCALVLTGDEETGGFDGARHLVEDLGLRARTVFNPDGPEPGQCFVPCKGEKGILHLSLSSSGKAAHGATPWKGRNAIELLIEDIGRVQQVLPLTNSFEEFGVTLNIGRISGGDAINSVPAFAEADLDIRYPGSIAPSDLYALVENALQHSTIRVVMEAPAVHISVDNLALHTLKAAIQEFGYEGEPAYDSGASDARWFVKQGSNILLMLPLTTDFHIAGEGVHLESLQSFYRIIERFAECELSRLAHLEQTMLQDVAV
jgi:succinyl-diaminopimelate desuccinylase